MMSIMPITIYQEMNYVVLPDNSNAIRLVTEIRTESGGYFSREIINMSD